MENKSSVIGWTGLGLFLFALVCAFGMWGCPQYNVYQQRAEGQAILRARGMVS